MPAIIEFENDEGMIISSHQVIGKNRKNVNRHDRKGVGSHVGMTQSRNQKNSIVNRYSTRRNVGEKKDSYRAIANSIYVDENWMEYLENPLIMSLIAEFLELKDLLQHLIYVSKSWQDFVLEKFSEKFKEQYLLENELYFYRKFRMDAGTSDFMGFSHQQDMEDEADLKKVKFSIEKEGKEIIPPELSYDRNLNGKFLYSQLDKPERYALFVRYTCLDRAREAIRKYINYLLDEYTQCSGSDAKYFRKFIGWNEWNITQKNSFHQSFLEQAKMWYACSYSCCEISKKLSELFDMSKDVVTFSGAFANFDIEIRVEKSGKTRVVFDDVAQFEEYPMKTMENYNSITWFDEERFVSKKQQLSDRDFEMVD